MTNIKRNDWSEKPSFKYWNLDALDKVADMLQDACKDAMGEALRHATDELGVEIVLMGTVDTPLKINVLLPLGDDDDNKPTFTFDLEQVFGDYVDKAPGWERDAKAATVKALRRMADKMETELPVED